MKTTPILEDVTQLENPEIISEIQRYIANNGPEEEEYQSFTMLVNELGQRITDQKIEKEAVSGFVRNMQLLNDVKSIMGHICQKPYGYAGDFSIIDRIYTRNASREYRKWDDYSLANSAAQAVRNRKDYFKKVVSQKIHGQGKLLNIASGPGRDLFEYYIENPNSKVVTTCVELDREAIYYAGLLNKEFASKIDFVNKNILLYKATVKFDLIWSAGLFDYFNDRQFVVVLKSISRWLEPGGEIVIGNFNQEHNPSRLYMELFGEWFLNHRTSDELMELAKQAGFKDEHINVGHEPENVNLFLHLKRD
ncbi:class I SAM-dependent methyltransferase [Hymenobacter koreensis]|uniref:Methyltransferase domain-containing protein n=1 Tax=Hymenobacter koreensis TaxID=1084523 RepID=A0ABP8J8T3_9BACT